jgi:Tfp pilus assembly protein PilV
MPHKPVNQKGFAAIEAVLIVVILAIIGGTGYYVYQANNKSTETQNAAQLAAQSAVKHTKKSPAKTASQAFVISEWSVEAVNASKDVTPQYKIVTQTNQQWADFSSAELTAADPTNCGVNQQAGGTISRAKAQDHLYTDGGDDTGKTIQQAVADGSLKNYKKVSDYYYWYEPGQADCSSSDTTIALQTKTRDAIKAMVSKLEAVPKQ